MADTFKVGIIGGGWRGGACGRVSHRRGIQDRRHRRLIAPRREIIAECGPLKEFTDVKDLIADREGIDVVSVCSADGMQ